MMTMKKILFTALLCVVSQIAMAQATRISGTVSDNDGPIMMANVVERDANNRIVSATQTDFNGNFSMQVKNTKNKLVFSYVGDKTKVLNIGSQTTFKVHLDPENTQLKEVVVKSKRQNTGGLMMSKKEVSVAQQTFSMESVEGLSFTSADEALQGEIAGLDIVSNSGNLGAGTTMRLRGVSTITGNANPLIVVDEKIFDNPDEDFDFANANEEQFATLLSVNVEDIASINVLKDAAATAIWGANGANGVIEIKTKRGSRGQTRVNFSYKFTGTWMPEGYTLLDGDHYTMLMKEEFFNPAQLSEGSNNQSSSKDLLELNYDKSWGAEWENWNNNTDWVKAVKQFGQMHSWNVNLTGGGQKATFRISAGYDLQTGTVIKQKLDRFTTRMVLDYNVSDRIRFSTNFALTYTNNQQNYSNILGIAQRMAPNMSIYRQDGYGNDTDEYYIMLPTGKTGQGASVDGTSSTELSAIRSLGNPVAIANEAWKTDRNYRITPDFSIKYELLGTEAEKSRLTFNGRVDFDIYAQSLPAYWPASLTTNSAWQTDDYNLSTDSETNRLKIGGRTELVFTPYFKNDDWHSSMLVRYEMNTSKSNRQYIPMSFLPNDITSSTVYARLGSKMSSSNSRSNSQNALFNGYVSWKERYSLTVTFRADGNSKFGPKNKWAYFPSASLRWNLSEEPFMKWSRKVVSVFSLRGSYGVNGRAPSADYLFYNTYTTQNGFYGQSGTSLQPVATLDGLKLDDLRWEKKIGMNVGGNLGLFDNRIEIDFDYYHNETHDMLMEGVRIPSYVGFATLKYANVGRMDNDGWELNLNAKDIIKKGKFSFGASFNVAQNQNELKEMDQRVLDALNTEWDASMRGDNKSNWMNRIQIGNPLASIYGFRYQGTYSHSYDYLENYKKEHKLSASEYEQWINQFLADGNTAPVVTDAQGKVLMNNQGSPMRMVYNYDSDSGSDDYKFTGGDAKYEDVNHDGQLNALDIVYLGNSLPKVNGGLNLNFKYGNWALKFRFNYRFGNKVVNLARMNLEKMYDAYNQSSTVNWRWRQEGDQTPMPRALRAKGYNFQPSDRYVEDGGFVRWQNLQLSYNFPKKLIKNWGLNNLQAYFSMNNLYVWTRYSGIDPEVSPVGYRAAYDESQTPRSKQFTATINVGF